MFDIDGRRIDASTQPYIIAEVGMGHRGDLGLAKRLIDAAAQAGADAVKFQSHLASAEMAESAMRAEVNGDLYDRIKRFELSAESHRELQAYCADAGITFLSTPYSAEAVELLDELDVPAIKIGSAELTNPEVTGAAADTGRPLLVSTGMADWHTIEDVVPPILDRASATALLHCVSAYPTPEDQLNLGVMAHLRREFDVPVGYSDHSAAVAAPLLAVGAGAAVIEVHFTIDRALPGGDQEVAVEPDELAWLTRLAELAGQAFGAEKPVLPAERDVAAWARHSVVAARQIDAGEALTAENTTTKRPATGISATKYPAVLGREVSDPIEAGAVVTSDQLAAE